jgi:hypothetical protein
LETGYHLESAAHPGSAKGDEWKKSSWSENAAMILFLTAWALISLE